MSFLNAAVNHVFCKIAVHGPGAARVIDALASRYGVRPLDDDPGFRVFDFLATGYPIGPYALRPCVYGLDGSDDLRALLVGSDGIAVILDGSPAETETLASIAPFVDERVPVVLACPPPRDPHRLQLGYPVIAADPFTGDGAHAMLQALVPQVAEAARAKWANFKP